MLGSEPVEEHAIGDLPGQAAHLGTESRHHEARRKLGPERGDSVAHASESARVRASDAEEETTEESTQDIADKAVSSYTREFLYSLTDGERTVLLRIDEALNRIDDGT